MPNYEDLLTFLANNPPQLDAERDLHASLLELIAKCLRTSGEQVSPPAIANENDIARAHADFVCFGEAH